MDGSARNTRLLGDRQMRKFHANTLLVIFRVPSAYRGHYPDKMVNEQIFSIEVT